jgi:hypothetical protein
VLLNRSKTANRCLALIAVCVLALGTTLVTAGSASAAARIGRFAKIKFYSKYRVVTMNVPLSCPKLRQPPCDWMLYVNEPENPAEPVVGTQTAASGSPKILQVSYPRDFCGVIQADVVVGPSPWQFETGRVREINTADPRGHNNSAYCPHTPPDTSTTQPNGPPHPPGGGGGGGGGGNDNGGNVQATTAATSGLPFSGSGSSGSGSTANGAVAADATTAATAAPATLPFTGADVKPLVVIGAAMILFGLYILSSLEQRRRALRRLGNAVSTGARQTSRASHWFLGD